MFKIKKLSVKGKYTKFPYLDIPPFSLQDNTIYGGHNVRYFTLSERTPDERKTIITVYAEVSFRVKTAYDYSKDQSEKVLDRLYRWKGYWEFVKFIDNVQDTDKKENS